MFVAIDTPLVLTFAWHKRTLDGQPSTLDGVTLKDCFTRLDEAGADVLGLNCARGPETMMPLMEEIKKLNLKVKQDNLCRPDYGRHDVNVLYSYRVNQ